MTAKQKRRLYTFGAIVAVAVIIWLLLRRRARNVVNQQGDFSIPDFDTAPFDLGDLPTLGVRASSRGCSVCYSGYGRIVAPSPPAPSPAPLQVINRYLSLTTVTRPSPPPPAPARAQATIWSAPASAAPAPWWTGMAPGGRA